MPGTKEGGLKAAAKIKELHGEDHYKNIGQIGGKNGHTGGFAYLKEHNPERLKELSSKGGQISRKSSNKAR